ncbi:MAG: ROK family transcriptional regulator, partial [Planctomycetaceae bacterium]|nr:ROK family transcriptional regulator [Planctomycetaceae bacterium]
DLSRETGISAPTVSKAVNDLLKLGFLEETTQSNNSLGRPGMKVRLATQKSRVLGIVLDSEECVVVPALLDGTTEDEKAIRFTPPDDYLDLLKQLAAAIASLSAGSDVSVLGIGISSPGLISFSSQTSLLVPSMEVLGSQCIAVDLERETGFTTLAMQESRALCLAENLFGSARFLKDFVMMDVGTWLSLGIFSNGSLFNGNDGLTGQLGHITVDPAGSRCRCGNQGCLGTIATDKALTASVNARSGQSLTVAELFQRIRSGAMRVDAELSQVTDYLAIGVAAVINLFNPGTIYLHGRMLGVTSDFLGSLIRSVRQRALPPSFEQCTIQAATVNRLHGAVAAIVHHLTLNVGPRLG